MLNIRRKCFSDHMIWTRRWWQTAGTYLPLEGWGVDGRGASTSQSQTTERIMPPLQSKLCAWISADCKPPNSIVFNLEWADTSSALGSEAMNLDGSKSSWTQSKLESISWWADKLSLQKVGGTKWARLAGVWLPIRGALMWKTSMFPFCPFQPSLFCRYISHHVSHADSSV